MTSSEETTYAQLWDKMERAAAAAGRTNTNTADLTDAERTTLRRLQKKIEDSAPAPPAHVIENMPYGDVPTDAAW